MYRLDPIFAKYFICVQDNLIQVSNNLDDLTPERLSPGQSIYEVFDMCGGETLFKLRFHEGDAFTGCKYMHMKSMLKIHQKTDIYCYDKSSYNWIKELINTDLQKSNNIIQYKIHQKF
jgi:hypothetical protein